MQEAVPAMTTTTTTNRPRSGEYSGREVFTKRMK
jgi:hypothetical protein